MTQPLNLRSDLAQLGDAELASRLEQCWLDYDAARKSWWWRWTWLPYMGSRGPIRHPRAYRFLSILGDTGVGPLEFLFAAAFSHKDGERWLKKGDPKLDAHLTLCEIQDIVDEAERRVAKRREAKS